MTAGNTNIFVRRSKKIAGGNIFSIKLGVVLAGMTQNLRVISIEIMVGAGVGRRNRVVLGEQ